MMAKKIKDNNITPKAEIELLYIWFGKKIDKSGNVVDDKEVLPFENKSICFSIEYHIDFNGDNINPKFTISKKYIDKIELDNYHKFYNQGDYKIKINCIVGKNGAGKTLLMEYLQDVLADSFINNNRVKNKQQYLLLYKYKNSGQIYEYNCFNSSICIVSDDYKEEICVKKIDRLEELAVVYYNNIFNDIQKFKNDFDYDFDKSNIYNIGNDCLLEHDCSLIRKLKNDYVEIDKLNIFRNSERKRKLYFLLNQKIYADIKKREKLKRLTRETIIISNSDYFSSYLEDKSNKYTDHSTFKESFNYLNDKCSRSIDGKYYTFLWKIARELWAIILYVLIRNIIDEETYGKLMLVDVVLKDNPLSFIVTNLNRLSSFGFYTFYRKNVEKIVVLCERLFNNLNDYKNSYNLYQLMIPINNALNKDKIFDLFSNYIEIQELLGYNEFLKFSFSPRFSSGESSLVSLFSRLNYILNDKKLCENENVLLLVDEGEMGFHPEWSKDYINTFLEYIKILLDNYKNNKIKNIHIIFATNLPMLLSDILPQDVIYLKDKDIVYNECKTAFGANILDLYSEPFFIDSGLIGSFAQEKINNILGFINSIKEDFNKYKNNVNEYNFIIDNIGDPVVKTYLKSLFNNKLENIGIKNA